MGNTVWDGREPFATLAYALEARTVDPTAYTAYNKGNFNAVQIFVNCTARAGSASTVFNFDTWDSKGNVWVEVLESAAVTVAAVTVYQIGGVGAAVTNVASVLHPGRRIRIRPVHGTADAHTYSVTVSWLRV